MVRKKTICGFCGGAGIDPFELLSNNSTCQVCSGRGAVEVTEPAIKCVFCNGSGIYPGKRVTCTVCGGKGMTTFKQKMSIKCPVCGGCGATRDSGLPCLTCKGKGGISQ